MMVLQHIFVSAKLTKIIYLPSNLGIANVLIFFRYEDHIGNNIKMSCDGTFPGSKFYVCGWHVVYRNCLCIWRCSKNIVKLCSL